SDAFFMFLIGLYAVRRRILQNPRAARDFLIIAIVVGLITLLASGAVIPLPLPHMDRRRVLVAWMTLLDRILNEQLMGIAYASALVLWMAYTRAGARVGHALAFAGRMSLTNYVIQIVIIVIFLDVWFFYFKISHLSALIAAVLVFALQIVASRWWMRHFR